MTLLNKKTSTVISIMHQTSITNHQLSMNQTNNHQSSTIINNNHVSSIIHHPSSIITHQSTITSSTKTFSTIPLTPSSSLNKNKRFNTNHSISLIPVSSPPKFPPAAVFTFVAASAFSAAAAMSAGETPSRSSESRWGLEGGLKFWI